MAGTAKPKTTIDHLDGCPKGRTEKTSRRFNRKGAWYESSGKRCIDCGARTASTPKKVNND